MGAAFTRFSSVQVSFYAYNVFIEAGIPPDQTHYVSLGLGITEILATVLCVSGSSAEVCHALMCGSGQSFKLLETELQESEGSNRSVLLLSRGHTKPSPHTLHTGAFLSSFLEDRRVVPSNSPSA